MLIRKITLKSKKIKLNTPSSKNLISNWIKTQFSDEMSLLMRIIFHFVQQNIFPKEKKFSSAHKPNVIMGVVYSVM